MVYKVAFTCIVLFSFHHSPMRRGVIKTCFAGYEILGEFKLLFHHPPFPNVPKLSQWDSQDLHTAFSDFNSYSVPKFLLAFSVEDVVK